MAEIQYAEIDFSEVREDICKLTTTNIGPHTYVSRVKPAWLYLQGTKISPKSGGLIAGSKKASLDIGTGGDIFTASTAATYGKVLDLSSVPSAKATGELVITTDKYFSVYKRTASPYTENYRAWPSPTVSIATHVNFKDTLYIFPYSTSTSNVAIDYLGNSVGVTRPDSTLLSPVSEPTTIDDTSGSPLDDAVRGIVQYSFSLFSGNSEGALSAPVTHDAGSGDSVRVTVDTRTLYPTYSSLQIYRSYANRTQPYAVTTGKIVITGSETADNFLDRQEDGELGELPLWHGDPPPRYVADGVDFLGRVFVLAEDNQTTPGLTTSELFWSDPNSIDSWWTVPKGNRISVGGDNGDVGVALVKWGKNLLIVQKRHLFVLSGTSSSNFRVDELFVNGASPMGVESKQLIAETQNGIYFFSNNRIWYLALQGGLTNISDGIQEFLDNHTFEADGDKITCLGYSDSGKLFASSQNYLLTYDEKSRSWSGPCLYGSMGDTPTYNDSITGFYPISRANNSAVPLIATAEDSQKTPSPVFTDSLVLLDFDGYRLTNFLVGGFQNPETIHNGTSVATIGPLWLGQKSSLKNVLWVDFFHTFKNSQEIIRERVNVGRFATHIYLSFVNAHVGASQLKVGVGIEAPFVSVSNNLSTGVTITFDKQASKTFSYRAFGEILWAEVAFTEHPGDTR